MSGQDAAQLVAPAVAGEAGAMRRLLVMLGPPVLRATRRILRESADAEEAAQDAMIAIVRDLASLREPGAVVGFATTTAARIAMRARRKRERERSRRADVELGSAPDRQQRSPAAMVSARERAERLLSLLDRLPAEQAEALVMRHVLGYEPAEIAAATNAPVNTVRSRIRLARVALARQLQAEPELRPSRKDADDE